MQSFRMLKKKGIIGPYLTKVKFLNLGDDG